MKPLYTLAQIREIEQQALHQGLPLMQRAGEAAAQFLLQQNFSHFLIVAGPGNNGGDALVVAALLQQKGEKIYVWQPLGRARAKDAKQAETRFLALNGELHDAIPPHADFDCIVDGLLGIGLDRPLDAGVQAIVEYVNAQKKPVLALDIPSGVNAQTGHCPGSAIQATWTLSFLADKVGSYTGAALDYCGKIMLSTLAVPAALYPAPTHYLVNTMPSRQALLRRHNAHKGLFGTLGIIGGAQHMQGAALLAARSALHTGAGKVHVGFAADDYPCVDSLLPDLMLHDAFTLLQEISLTTLAVGPGLGTSAQAKQLLTQALDSTLPLILDADALNLISGSAALKTQLYQRKADTLLTPHPAEAARLLNVSTSEVQAQRVYYAQTLAQTLQSHVILKGAGSVYTDGHVVYVNHSGNAALSVAGQGDVLTGFLAGLIGQGTSIQEAALLAMYIHGKAADDWRRDYPLGLGLTASETILSIRRILNSEKKDTPK